MKVQLRPDARPVQAPALRGAPDKREIYPNLRTNLGRCWDGGSGFGIAVCQPGNVGRETVIFKSAGATCQS